MLLPRRLLLGQLLCLSLYLLGPGCSSESAVEVVQPATPQIDGENSGTPTKKGTIGYSAMTLKNPFFKVIADELTKEASKHGFEVVVSDADDKLENQAKHVDNYIAQGMTAIVLNPVDRVAVGPIIKKANEAGIPVFTCDLECEAEGIQVAGHVGTDNYQGGKLAGEAMVKALGEAGGDVLVLALPEKNSCVLRVNGFKEILDAHNAGRDSGKINVVAELPCGGLRDPANKATGDSLQQYPNLRGIFAINDPAALGAWKALSQAGKAEQVTIVGFDGQLEGKQAIKEGKVFADPIQFPERMGQLTARAIAAHLNGDDYEAHVLIPTELYDKAAADADPALQ